MNIYFAKYVRATNTVTDDILTFQIDDTNTRQLDT